MYDNQYLLFKHFIDLLHTSYARGDFVERRCFLELFDFLLFLASPASEPSSSSSSRGTGHKSSRILGNGFTSTVTGFLGMLSKLEKLAKSSISSSGTLSSRRWGTSSTLSAFIAFESILRVADDVFFAGTAALADLILSTDRMLLLGLTGAIGCCDLVFRDEVLSGEELTPECFGVVVAGDLLLPIISLKEVIDDVGDVMDEA